MVVLQIGTALRPQRGVSVIWPCAAWGHVPLYWGVRAQETTIQKKTRELQTHVPHQTQRHLQKKKNKFPWDTRENFWKRYPFQVSWGIHKHPPCPGFWSDFFFKWGFWRKIGESKMNQIHNKKARLNPFHLWKSTHHISYYITSYHTTSYHIISLWGDISRKKRLMDCSQAYQTVTRRSRWWTVRGTNKKGGIFIISHIKYFTIPWSKIVLILRDLQDGRFYDNMIVSVRLKLKLKFNFRLQLTPPIYMRPSLYATPIYEQWLEIFTWHSFISDPHL